MSNSPPNFNVDTSDAADSPSPYAFNSKVMLGAVILLFLVIAFILLLHVYARWFLSRSSQSYVITRGIAPSTRHHNGLDKAAIAQLPTFVYTATYAVAENSAAGKVEESSVAMPAPECAVCLSEFQENEKGRILPACKHMFHTECIDMWFSSHTTCPLCRTNVGPAMATSTETTSTDLQPEAMEPPQGTADGNSATLRIAEYPCNVLFWGNQTQLGASLQEPSTSSLPPSRRLSLRTAGARALPEITIHIPPVEGNLLVSPSECGSAKCTTDQEAGSSQPRKSPGFGASIKRMLSRQSSRQKSPSSKGNEQSPK